MRRPTVIFLLLFLALAATYYFLNNREQPADISVTLEPTTEVRYLFTAEAGLPTSILIESNAGEVVEVARNSDNAWALIQPTQAQADQASAEAAASQVTTMQILDTIDVDPEIVGLTDPEYTMTINFTSGVERKVDIGVITPTESGYYVRDANGDIVIVSRSSVDALIGLLSNPPYSETPTPEAVAPSNTTPTP